MKALSITQSGSILKLLNESMKSKEALLDALGNPLEVAPRISEKLGFLDEDEQIINSILLKALVQAVFSECSGIDKKIVAEFFLDRVEMKDEFFKVHFPSNKTYMFLNTKPGEKRLKQNGSWLNSKNNTIRVIETRKADTLLRKNSEELDYHYMLFDMSDTGFKKGILFFDAKGWFSSSVNAIDIINIAPYIEDVAQCFINDYFTYRGIEFKLFETPILVSLIVGDANSERYSIPEFYAEMRNLLARLRLAFKNTIVYEKIAPFITLDEDDEVKRRNWELETVMQMDNTLASIIVEPNEMIIDPDNIPIVDHIDMGEGDTKMETMLDINPLSEKVYTEFQLWQDMPDPTIEDDEEENEAYVKAPLTSFSYDDLPEELQLPDDIYPERFRADEVLLEESISIAKRFKAFYEKGTPLTTCGIFGEQGTSKSTIARQVAALLGLPYHVEALSYTTEAQELTGLYELKDGNTEFVYSPLIKAMKYGGVVELAEINAPDPGVLKKFFSVFDGNRQITLLNGEIVKAHPYFFTIATANIGEAFVGSQQMDPALIDRFHPWLKRELPDEEIMQEIVRKNLPNDAYTERFMDKYFTLVYSSYLEVRNAIKVDDYKSSQQVIATRWFIRLCQEILFQGDILKAAEIMISSASGFEPDKASALLNTFKGRFGSSDSFTL